MKRLIPVFLAIPLSLLTASTAVAQQTATTAIAITPQQTSGMIGIINGQTARLNALNPGVPAPLATGARCPAQLSILDDQGNVLNTLQVLVNPGKSTNLDFIMTASGRLQIRAVITFGQPAAGSATGSATPMPISVCNLIPTLEIFDTNTGKTESVLSDFRFVSYPVLAPGMMGGGSVTPLR